MRSHTNRSTLCWAIGLSLGVAFSTGAVFAGSITDTYATGDSLTAAKMDNIKNAVNDNYTRITTSSGTCQGNDSTDIMVRVGPLCVDKYEAKIYTAKTGGSAVATPGTACNVNGNDCTYAARSVLGVTPSSSVTWFQAQQACGNAGKRLLTNAEWQMAAAGTSETTCNLTSGVVGNTGATVCASRWLVNDMVGNLNEWVADWVPGSTANVGGGTTLNTSAYGDDAVSGINVAYSAGAPVEALPAALYRGGAYGASTAGGVFSLNAAESPAFSGPNVGFRCAR